MVAVKTLLDRLQTSALVWLARGHVSSWVVAGALATAGISAAALSGAPGSPAPQSNPTSGSPMQSLSSYGCYNDPDGDGHIFCDGSVGLSQLPASFGFCYDHSDYGYGYGRIFCTGTGR